MSWQTAAIFGLIHLLLYVGFILLVPIFLITAGLLAAWNHWIGGKSLPEGERAVPMEHPLPQPKGD